MPIAVGSLRERRRELTRDAALSARQPDMQITVAETLHRGEQRTQFRCAYPPVTRRNCGVFSIYRIFSTRRAHNMAPHSLPAADEVLAQTLRHACAVRPPGCADTVGSGPVSALIPSIETFESADTVRRSSDRKPWIW